MEKIIINDLVKTEVADAKKKPIAKRDVKKYTKEEEGAFAKELKRLNELAENTNKIVPP